MVVSAVDLLYLFGRSFVLSDEVTLLVQFVGNQCGDLVFAAIDPGCGLRRYLIIYRPLY